MSNFSDIPVIDIGGLRSGSARERIACADSIGRACRDVGFFYVTNHGVDDRLVEDVYGVGAEFFALPREEKMRVAMSKSPWFRGYLPLGGETTDPAFGADPKEGFDISLDLPLSDPEVVAGKVLRGPNQWPAAPTRLRPVLSAYYDTLCDLGRVLSRGFALALDLPEDFFAARLARPTAILRVLHYPGNPQADLSAELPDFGCGAHTDYGYLTILAQDSNGGLQVQNTAGKWVDARPIKGSFVCNIGDMMAQWTNDEFRATQHRVVRRTKGSRYSIPFFFHPDPDVEIRCLESCMSDGRPSRYPPTTSGAHLLGRLKEGYA
jgi:isopenicillin N synthase-like dioxygenase